jgi:predicted peptidase
VKTALFALACWSTAATLYATETLELQPGKQLPQSITLTIDGGEASRQVTVPYLLFVPQDYREDETAWPLLLFLHGYGECGDGGDELVRAKIHGPAKRVDSQPDFPFVLVTPQCPKPERSEVVFGWKPDQLIKLIDHLVGELNVDRERIYVTGLSMGGFGTWRLAAAYPDRFAAAVPICGGGEPDKMAAALSTVPIWCFHGAQDPVVPLARTKDMVDAVKQAGGDVKLTVYPDAGHDSWTETYDNPNVYEWLLSHRLREAAPESD